MNKHSTQSDAASTVADEATQPTTIFCLSSINCLRGGDEANIKLTAHHKHAVEALFLELNLLARFTGIRRLISFTLTFGNPVPDRETREACLLKIRKQLLQKQFSSGVTIIDRSESGRPHYHLIAVGSETADYRAGFDFDAWDAGRAAEKKWNNSGHADHAAAQLWRAKTDEYVASATPDLLALWPIMSDRGAEFGFGRINVLPVRHPDAYARYLAKCVANGFSDNHPDDRGIRRVRFWGKFPRRVTPLFYRNTKPATRWRGKLAFCALILGFSEFGDFSACFGRFWFIHLQGIIRLVPTPVAEASLLTRNLPQNLIAKYRRQLYRIETELRGRQDRYGRQPKSTN